MTQAEDDLSTALRKFSESYRMSIRYTETEAAQQARELINKAHRILDESGVGDAFTRQFAHARDSWKDRSEDRDFPLSGFTFKNEERWKDGKDTWLVEFNYNGTLYKSSINYDNSAQNDNFFVDLIVGNEEVLKASWRGYLSWDAATVHSFKIGEWMKELLKIDADIEQYASKKEIQARELDLIDRASKIET